MSSTGAPKNEWLVIIPDYEGKLEERMKVRPQHLSNLKPSVDSGLFTFGGAMLVKPLTETDGKPDIMGSAMLVQTDTKEEVLEALKKDIYTTSGVWDLSKVQIYPFKTALRQPL